MILFNEINKKFRRSNSSPRGPSMLSEKFTRRLMQSLRQASLARKSTTKQSFNGGDKSLGAQQKVHRFSRLVDGAVEIGPPTLDLDVDLIHAPRSAALAREAVPPLFELRSVALDPAHDGRMGQRQAAFGHHFPEDRSCSASPVTAASGRTRPGDYGPLTPFAPEPPGATAPAPFGPIPICRRRADSHSPDAAEPGDRTRRAHEEPRDNPRGRMRTSGSNSGYRENTIAYRRR